MVLLGLLLAAVAIALGVGLALQPGDTANVHFFGLNIPNLNGRTLVLIGVAIGVLFMVGLWFIKWGISVSRRRRRARKAEKRALAEAKREAAEAREQEARTRQDAEQREPDYDTGRRQEEAAAWERAEAARREEAARQEEAALRARSENHQPDPYPPASPDAYQGHRPPEPYRGDTRSTDVYPVADSDKTEEYPTVDPYREEPRPTGTVYQSGGHSYPDNDPYSGQHPQHRPY